MKTTEVHNIPARPAIPASKKEVSIVYCDIDKRKIGAEGVATVYRCSLCKRDICSKHRKWDERDYGDYPASYCTTCHDLAFVKYDKEYYDMQDRHDKEEEELMNKIRKESLESIVS